MGKTTIEDRDKTIAQQLEAQNNIYKQDFINKDKLKTGVDIGTVTEERSISGKFDKSHLDKQLGEGNLNLQYYQQHLQKQMDDNQSNWSSALNAGVTGAIGAFATTAEHLSYLPNVVKQWTTSGAAEWESNAIADAAKDFKEGLC